MNYTPLDSQAKEKTRNTLVKTMDTSQTFSKFVAGISKVRTLASLDYQRPLSTAFYESYSIITTNYDANWL